MNITPDKLPHFSESIMEIRKLSNYKDKEIYPDLISGINSIRTNYQWSQKTYNESNVDNVYLISSNGTTFGFIECSYQNLDICTNSPPKIFLHEIHIALSMHDKGVGKSVLNHLLKKGLCIEMVIANENKKMLGLVSMFNHEIKYTTKNTRTVILKSAVRTNE